MQFSSPSGAFFSPQFSICRILKFFNWETENGFSPILPFSLRYRSSKFVQFSSPSGAFFSPQFSISRILKFFNWETENGFSPILPFSLRCSSFTPCWSILIWQVFHKYLPNWYILEGLLSLHSSKISIESERPNLSTLDSSILGTFLWKSRIFLIFGWSKSSRVIEFSRKPAGLKSIISSPFLSWSDEHKTPLTIKESWLILKTFTCLLLVFLKFLPIAEPLN